MTHSDITSATTERVRSRWTMVLQRTLMVVTALIAFAFVLLMAGKDPIAAYRDTFAYTLGNFYGLSEVLVRMTPLLLTGVAVALPSKMGLINIGGEGQLFLGAWLTTWVALTFDNLPALILLPLMILTGFIGGGLWAGVAAWMKAQGWVSETISTVLLNYVAPMIVGYSIFGPWRSTDLSSYPQSAKFAPNAMLPAFFNTRVNLGFLIALVAVALAWFLINKTRWGLEMRAIGGNAEAAQRLGIPVRRYILIILMIGGGVAGIAGMSEVAGIHGRLRLGLSPGYGFVGFLASWLAGGDPIGLVVMSFLLAVITSSGDILQISQGLPYAVVNVLNAIILFIVLAKPNFYLRHR